MRVLLPLTAVVAVAAGWFGSPLVHPTSAPASAPRGGGRSIIAIGPRTLSLGGLEGEAARLAQPLFWAGPVRGARYEFTRTSSGRLFLRYLPRGVRAGTQGGRLPVVATYPFPFAYKALKRVAHGKGVVGPGGSFIYARPNDTKSVLLAFPRAPYEIEVYAPRPGLAAALAETGHVRPVG